MKLSPKTIPTTSRAGTTVVRMPATPITTKQFSALGSSPARKAAQRTSRTYKLPANVSTPPNPVSTESSANQIDAA